MTVVLNVVLWGYTDSSNPQVCAVCRDQLMATVPLYIPCLPTILDQGRFRFRNREPWCFTNYSFH